MSRQNVFWPRSESHYERIAQGGDPRAAVDDQFQRLSYIISFEKVWSQGGDLGFRIRRLGLDRRRPRLRRRKRCLKCVNVVSGRSGHGAGRESDSLPPGNCYS